MSDYSSDCKDAGQASKDALERQSRNEDVDPKDYGDHSYAVRCTLDDAKKED